MPWSPTRSATKYYEVGGCWGIEFEFCLQSFCGPALAPLVGNAASRNKVSLGVASAVVHQVTCSKPVYLGQPLPGNHWQQLQFTRLLPLTSIQSRSKIAPLAAYLAPGQEEPVLRVCSQLPSDRVWRCDEHTFKSPFTTLHLCYSNVYTRKIATKVPASARISLMPVVDNVI